MGSTYLSSFSVTSANIPSFNPLTTHLPIPHNNYFKKKLILSPLFSFLSFSPIPLSPLWMELKWLKLFLSLRCHIIYCNWFEVTTVCVGNHNLICLTIHESIWNNRSKITNGLNPQWSNILQYFFCFETNLLNNLIAANAEEIRNVEWFHHQFTKKQLQISIRPWRIF